MSPLDRAARSAVNELIERAEGSTSKAWDLWVAEQADLEGYSSTGLAAYICAVDLVFAEIALASVPR